MDVNQNNYKVGQVYYANEITNYKFYGIYDWLIASVDGALAHLSDWHAELMTEIWDEGAPTLEDAKREALEDITNNIWVAYEGAKHITIFRGIAPKGGFDVYTRFECISNERSE